MRRVSDAAQPSLSWTLDSDQCPIGADREGKSASEGGALPSSEQLPRRPIVARKSGLKSGRGACGQPVSRHIQWRPAARAYDIEGPRTIDAASKGWMAGWAQDISFARTTLFSVDCLVITHTIWLNLSPPVATRFWFKVRLDFFFPTGIGGPCPCTAASARARARVCVERRPRRHKGMSTELAGKHAHVGGCCRCRGGDFPTTSKAAGATHPATGYSAPARLQGRLWLERGEIELIDRLGPTIR